VILDSRAAVSQYSAQLIERSGFSDRRFPAGYDAHRPAPPSALLDLLCQVSQVERPRLVVDLGCGTGLSTRAWADRADEVVGVEASEAMQAQAEAETGAANVRYVNAFGDATGLRSEAADIVTCSQSFHWMEPASTLAEVARILRPGGVFAAYDYDWPPIVQWEVEAAFEEMLRRIRRHRRERPRHEKAGHLGRIAASGYFRYTCEALVHSRETGGAGRIIGIAFSLGPLTVLLEGGLSEEELGLAKLRETAARVLDDREVPWFLCYRVRLGVK
jgi:SAM-dependent methyltransferase